MCADITDEYFHLERSKKSNLDIQITGIGGLGLGEGKIGHGNLSYIESIEHGDALALDLGGGVSYDAGATFYVGLGVLLGYNFDNRDLIGTYYPQIGVVVQITKTFGLIATGKRYSNLYSTTEGENIVMFGLLIGSRQ